MSLHSKVVPDFHCKFTTLSMTKLASKVIHFKEIHQMMPLHFINCFSGISHIAPSEWFELPLMTPAAISRSAFKRQSGVTRFIQTHFSSLPPNVSIFKWRHVAPKVQTFITHPHHISGVRTEQFNSNRPVLSRILTEPETLSMLQVIISLLLFGIKKEEEEEFFPPDHSRRNPITAVFGDQWDYSVSKRGKNNQSLSDFQL